MFQQYVDFSALNGAQFDLDESIFDPDETDVETLVGALKCPTPCRVLIYSFGTIFEHHATVIHFRELARTFKFELGADEHRLFVCLLETEWRPPENATVHAPQKSSLSIDIKILSDQQSYYFRSAETKSSFSRKYFNIVLRYPKSSAPTML
jgi:hypothetical protein